MIVGVAAGLSERGYITGIEAEPHLDSSVWFYIYRVKMDRSLFALRFSEENIAKLGVLDRLAEV